MHKIKEMLKEELKKYEGKGISAGSLDVMHKLLDSIKNIDKIELLEEESEDYSEARGSRGRGRYSYMGGSSYDDDMMYSERRGRGRYAKRDSMGRYSSEGGSYEGGSSYDDYSEESLYRGSSGYSRGEAKEYMMNKLGMMMEDADPKEREALKECMRAIERA